MTREQFEANVKITHNDGVSENLEKCKIKGHLPKDIGNVTTDNGIVKLNVKNFDFECSEDKLKRAGTAKN